MPSNNSNKGRNKSGATNPFNPANPVGDPEASAKIFAEIAAQLFAGNITKATGLARVNQAVTGGVTSTITGGQGKGADSKVGNILQRYLNELRQYTKQEQKNQKEAGKEDNQQQATKKTTGEISKLGEGGKLLFNRLIAMIGPAAAVSAILASTVSGLGPFLSSLKLAATLFGAFLAPVMILFAGIMFAMISVIAGPVIAGLKGFAGFIFQIVKFGDGLEGLIDKIAIGVAKFLANIDSGIANMRFALDILLNVGKPSAQGWKDKQMADLKFKAANDVIKLAEDKINAGKRLAAPDANDPLAKPGDFGKLLREGMQGALQEMKMASGPQATSSDLISASRNAQLAALNQSPFEAKMLDISQQILGALEEALGKAMQPAVVR